MGSDDARYVEGSFLGASPGTRTSAHELLHLLSDSDHPDVFGIAHGPNIPGNLLNGQSLGERINRWQINRIRQLILPASQPRL